MPIYQLIMAGGLGAIAMLSALGALAALGKYREEDLTAPESPENDGVRQALFYTQAEDYAVLGFVEPINMATVRAALVGSQGRIAAARCYGLDIFAYRARGASWEEIKASLIESGALHAHPITMTAEEPLP